MKFSYRAKGRAEGGKGRWIEGEMDAPSASEAASRLVSQGLIPVDITAPKDRGARGHFLVRCIRALGDIGTAPLWAKTLFFKDLETFLSAGVPLGTALYSLERSAACRPLAKKISLMARAVEQGEPFSRALEAAGIVGSAELAVVESGQESGLLGSALGLVADDLERQEELLNKLRSAMIYPAAVFMLSSLVMWVLFRSIVPRFAQVFAHMNVAMTPLSAWLFEHSDLLSWSLGALPLALAALYGLYRLCGLFEPLRKASDRTALWLPLIGSIAARWAWLRATATGAALLGAGVPLLRSLELSAAASGNSVVAEAINALHEAASRGQSLASAARGQRAFQAVAVQLLDVGESTGEMPRQLKTLAMRYDRQLEESLKRLTALMEPLLMLIVGVITGIVVWALFSPVLSAISGLSGVGGL